MDIDRERERESKMVGKREREKLTVRPNSNRPVFGRVYVGA